MSWLLTIVHRSRPGNTEWQYKTVVSRLPPELWLADRLEAVEMGETPRVEINIVHAREISEQDALVLTRVLESRGG